MGNIESPLGHVSVKSKQQKNFVVDDPTAPQVTTTRQFGSSAAPEEQPQEEMESSSLSLAKKVREDAKRVDADNKEKIECLLGIRKRRASTTIDGHVFTLRSLESAESREFVRLIANEKTRLDEIYTTKHAIIAFSFDEFDGTSISDLLGEELDNIEGRLAMVREMSEDLVDELVSLYNTKIQVKLPETKEEAKEVLEDIKK